MIWGLVSNCWKRQLAEGVPLEALIATAVERGCRAVELRQTALGRFESGAECLPDATAVGELPRRFPDVRFNLALSVPFMGVRADCSDRLIACGLDAARALAGRFRPHLRLVDVETRGECVDAARQETAAFGLGEVAGALAESGGTLSIENALQPWKPFREVFLETRRRLGVQASALRICFDPCNLLLAGDGTGPVEAARTLSPEEISMLHCKQRQADRPLPTVGPGDVDWPTLAEVFKRMGYDGPALLEIEPHEGIWQNVTASREYLQRIGVMRD